MTNFNLYSKYYNLFYEDKDYSSEVDYVIKCLKKFAPQAATLLEFGSGTGGHGLLLAEKGFDVFGLERSEEMVAKAKEKGFACQRADIASFELDKQYDAVISLFHVISYLTSNDGLLACFQNAHRHLRPSGIFLFDVWYSPAVFSQKPETRMKQVTSNEVEVIRFAEPRVISQENLVDVNYTVWVKDRTSGDTDSFFENHPMRHFSIPEIDLLARMTGFKIERVEEFGTGEEVSEETWGACFILRKDR